MIITHSSCDQVIEMSKHDVLLGIAIHRLNLWEGMVPPILSLLFAAHFPEKRQRAVIEIRIKYSLNQGVPECFTSSRTERMAR